MNIKKMKIGSPGLTWLPQKPASQVGAFSFAVLTGLTVDHASAGSTALVLTSVTVLLSSFWLHGQNASRELRDGYLFKAPRKLKRASKTNWQATDHFKEVGIDTVVSEKRSAQYRILMIPNKTPKQVQAQMSALSMVLDAEESEMIFMQNFRHMTSAILVPFRNHDEWQEVTLNKEVLEAGKLIGYIGKSVTDEDVFYDRRHESHMLVGGSTNAGKTQAMILDIVSMRYSGMNPEIHIYDPKGELVSMKADFHTQDIKEAVVMLEELAFRAKTRMNKYAKEGCSNFFEYREKVNATESPLFAYIDEATDLLVNKLAAEEKPQKGEPIEKEHLKWSVRAYDVIFEISRLHRAGGLFLTMGMQHPKAEIVPTEIRNNFSARLAMNVPDAAASRVILDRNGAESLPKFGGFYFKTSLRAGAPVLGRGALIK